MSFYLLLILIIAGQGFLLFSVMIFRVQKRFSDIILSLLVLIFSYHVFYIFLINSGYISHVPFLIATCFALQTLVPVMFYWYITKNDSRKLSRTDYWHFLPFVIHLSFWLPFFFMAPDVKLGIIHGEIESTMFKTIGFKSGITLQVMLFAYYGIKLWDRNIKGKSEWLSKCKKAFFLMAGIFIVDGFFYLFVTSKYFPFFHLILAGIIYCIAYNSFNNQKQVFSKAKYINAKLEPTHVKAIMTQLEAFMTNERPYLNRNLRIKDLSDVMGWSEADVSQAINSSKNMSFRDFINSYRIDEAKRILANDQFSNLKNLAVAFDSGFNNKVSFYKSFTKFVGMTPKEFRENSNSLI